MRPIRVGYKKEAALYYCDGGSEKSSRRCFSFGSVAIDQQVSEQLCEALAPHAIEASLQAAAASNAQRAARSRTPRCRSKPRSTAPTAPSSSSTSATPRNRLVADTLEQRLDQKLAELPEAKERHRRTLEGKPGLQEHAAELLRTLGRDFPRVWQHRSADAKLKKRILRAAIAEILVKPIDDQPLLEVTIHWQGGVHTRCQVDRPSRTKGNSKKSIEELLRSLAEDLDDREIARVLNLNGTTTPSGLRWTQDRVRDQRRQHRIVNTADPARRTTMTMNQLQAHFGISPQRRPRSCPARTARHQPD